MLQHRPEGDRIELLLPEIVVQEVTAYDLCSLRLGVIQSRPAHVRAPALVAARKALLQLMQKCSGRAPDIQNRPACAMLAEQPQFSLEPHGCVVAREFVG